MTRCSSRIRPIPAAPMLRTLDPLEDARGKVLLLLRTFVGVPTQRELSVTSVPLGFTKLVKLADLSAEPTDDQLHVLFNHEIGVHFETEVAITIIGLLPLPALIVISTFILLLTEDEWVLTLGPATVLVGLRTCTFQQHLDVLSVIDARHVEGSVPPPQAVATLSRRAPLATQ